MKSDVTILLALISGVAMLAFWMIALVGIPLFEREESLLSIININGTEVKVAYVETGATTSDVIQVYVEEFGNCRLLSITIIERSFYDFDSNLFSYLYLFMVVAVFSI
ncbi:hypothetical protein [Chitinophaga deserti]|uniref:hypothetical protein n=1 Tax=Chitinophaga deserti TaxID=2164099 RepID=UPI000D6D92BB|nr:hypothetical protein [Chitinophaga deserti]